MPVIDRAGPVFKRLADIHQDFEAAVKAPAPEGLGADFDYSPDSHVRQLLSPAAKAVAEVHTLAQQVYSAFSLQAEGADLDNLVAIFGLGRKPSTAARGVVLLTGTPGTRVAMGKQVRDPATGRVFALSAEAIIQEPIQSELAGAAEPGDVAVTVESITGFAVGQVIAIGAGDEIELRTVTAILSGFRLAFATPLASAHDTGEAVDTAGTVAPVQSLTVGALAVPAQSISAIVTPVLGWAAVTQPFDLDPGEDEETDADLLARFLDERRAVAGGTDLALKRALSALADVDGVLVKSNRTLLEDEAGLPPKSFRAVIHPDLSGDAEAVDAIARAIAQNMPPGIEAFGDESATVDQAGEAVPVAWTWAAPVDIYVKATVKCAWVQDAAPFAAAILAAADNAPIGRDYSTALPVGALLALPGVLEVKLQAKAGSLPVSVWPADTAEIPIADHQVARVQQANIQVTVTT